MKIDNGNDWFGGFARNEDLFFPLKVCALTQAEVHQSARYLVSSTITVITINVITLNPITITDGPPGFRRFSITTDFTTKSIRMVSCRRR